eukprot:4445886-Prymnesium_polylepis.2
MAAAMRALVAWPYHVLLTAITGDAERLAMRPAGGAASVGALKASEHTTAGSMTGPTLRGNRGLAGRVDAACG